MPDINKIAYGMGMLIFAFLLLSRADEANRIINALGSFVTNQTRALQGVGAGNTYQLIGKSS